MAEIQEVLQQILTALGEDRLRVELHAPDRIAAMTHRHDRAVRRRGRDLQAFRQAGGVDCERVVAHDVERVGQPPEQLTSVMANARDLAVYHRGGAHDATAVDLANALVAQADAQRGYARPQPANGLNGDP